MGSPYRYILRSCLDPKTQDPQSIHLYLESTKRTKSPLRGASVPFLKPYCSSHVRILSLDKVIFHSA